MARVAQGLNKIRRDRATFFAVIASAPDTAAAERTIAERFEVSAEVAAAAMQESVRSLMRPPDR